MSWVSAPAIARVFVRHAKVFRYGWPFAIFSMVLQPALFLFSFTVGLGTLVTVIEIDGAEVSYRAFLFAGMVGLSTMWQGYFAATYGGYTRLNDQRLHLVITVTPVTLDEYILGDLAWNVFRTSLTPMAILALGYGTGQFLPSGLAPALLLCLVGSLTFSALGTCVAGLTTRHQFLAFAQAYLLYPMFLMGGFMYPLDRLPDPVETFMWLYPLVPLLECFRGVLLGLPLGWPVVLLTLAWAIGLTVVSHIIVVRRVRQ